MKKLILLALIFVSTFTFSQDVKYGLNGGLNISNPELSIKSGLFSVDLNTDARSSIYFGGFAEFGLQNSEHKFQLGLNFVKNGTKFSIQDFDFIDSVEITISQLVVPVLYKFSVYEGLFLNAGAYAGLILDVEGKYTETEFPGGNTFSETEDISDEFRRLDAGLSLGLEYNLDNGLFFEVRYNYGLLNISDDDNEDGSVSFKNRFFNIGIGFKF